MKITYIVFIFLVSTGCASKASLVKVDEPNRKTASGTSKIPDFGKSGLPSIYQGPFEIGLDGFPRKAAKAYLPLQYDSKASWPLVVMLHGFSGTAEAQDLYFGLRFRTSLRGFILLTPEGTVTPQGTFNDKGEELGGNPFWNATDSCCDFGKTKVNDSEYLLSLIENVKQKYKVDTSRVYLIGHSNGGFMVNRLGCDAGTSFAGIANLAGGTFKDPKNCKTPAPVPYLQIHAEDDKTIRYDGDSDYAGATETVEQWLEKNGCQKASVKGPKKDLIFLIPGRDTKSVAWNNCRSGKEVALWTIQKFEHKKHNPHVPIFHLGFTDAVLDFLFKQKND